MTEPITTEQITTTKMAEPVHLIVTRNAKGEYQYEISIHAATVDEVLAQTKAIDDQVKAMYRGQLSGETRKT